MSLGEKFEPVIDAARTGASWALEALYRDLHPRVLAYLRAREPGMAEDLASETWIGVARAIPTFCGVEEEFRAFVFTVARRRLLDLRRTESTRKTAPGDPETIASLGPTGDAEHEAMDRIGNGWAMARIAELPPDQAEVVLLRVLGDLPVTEVAEILGKRPGAVRALQHRAVQRLAREISKGAVTR